MQSKTYQLAIKVTTGSHRSELHSTQLLWNNLLFETRKAARERGTLAEFYNTEMQVMLDIMLKDLHLVTKKVNSRQLVTLHNMMCTVSVRNTA